MELTQRQKISLWLDDLRGNGHLQGKHRLENGGTFCCLGRACEVAIQNGCSVDVTDDYGDVRYDNEIAGLPESVKEWYGFKTSDGDHVWIEGEEFNLADLNDVENYTFEQIATVVEENMDNIFNLE